MLTCSLGILRTKLIGEWSLKVMSYLFFALFFLYWKSGGQKMDNFAIIILFTGFLCNSLHQVMIKFCWDFIFRFANGGVANLTWNEVISGHFEVAISVINVELIQKQVFEDIIRYELRMTHPMQMPFHYSLDFDADVEVFSGQAILTYNHGKIVILNAGDFIIVKRKEIHKIDTISDTVFKFSCRR